MDYAQGSVWFLVSLVWCPLAGYPGIVRLLLQGICWVAAEDGEDRNIQDNTNRSIPLRTEFGSELNPLGCSDVSKHESRYG